MAENKKERVKSIDVVRILAIILVIGFHLAYNLTFDNSLRQIGFVGISLFFIVSGYVLARNYPNLNNFSLRWFLKRLVRIASLYYLALIALVILFGRQIYSGNLAGNLISHFLFIDFLFSRYSYAFISPAWFLIPLVFLYLFYPYLNRYIRKSSGFLFLAFIVMIAIRLHDGSFTSFSPLFFIGDFCFGIAFSQGQKKEALVISLLTIFVNPVMFVSYVVFYALTFIKWRFVPQRVLDFVGSQVFALFLFHESFMKVLLGRWHIWKLDILASISILLVFTLFVVFLSGRIQRFLLSKRYFNVGIKLSKKLNKKDVG